MASGYDLGGTVVWGQSAGQDCSGWQLDDDYAFFPINFTYAIGTPRVRIETRCGSWAGCSRNGVASIRLRNVRVHVRDDAPPALTNGRGALWTSTGWLGGPQPVGFDASDGAGISEASVLVDGNELVHKIYGCDQTQRAPCPQTSVDAPLNTAGWGADGPHTVTLQAVDVTSLTRLGLVDEFQLSTVPIAIGAGRSPFADLREHLKLEVVEEQRFRSGALAQVLVPKR